MESGRLAVQSGPRVLLQIRELAESCRPVHRRHRSGVTLLTVDPRHSRFEITASIVAQCEVVEVEVIRAAFGLPPVSERAPDWVTDDELCLLWVPKSLRVPGQPALQGGSELTRRRRAGLLEWERLAYAGEIRTSAAKGA